jgi:nucleoside triphosphate pyrophosphatase
VSGGSDAGVRARSGPSAGDAPEAHAPLVLASSSPRRAALLRMLNLQFEVVPAHVDERLSRGEPPFRAVERLARTKAAVVARQRPDAVIIAGDTLVVCDGLVMGKPVDAEDAVSMLLSLAGREHEVDTGVAVAAPGAGLASAVERVRVRFRTFDREAALAYVATGEPLDKAGAYAIQGVGSTLVESIDGDFYGVVGLPVARLIGLLRSVGWAYHFRGLEPSGL